MSLKFFYAIVVIAVFFLGAVATLHEEYWIKRKPSRRKLKIFAESYVRTKLYHIEQFSNGQNLYIDLPSTQEEVDAVKGTYVDLYLTLAQKNNAETMKKLGPVLEGLLFLSLFHQNFQRTPRSLNIKTQGSVAQFHEMVEHLLVKFDTPLFLRNSWLDKAKWKERFWYMQLGTGSSVRDLTDFPVEVSKKMAGFFREANENHTVDQAILWARMRANGGDKDHARILSYSLFLNHFSHEDKNGLYTIQFFALYPAVEIWQLNQYIEYIADQFKNDPNFNLKGKTIQSIAAASEVYLKQKRKDEMMERNWNESGIPVLEGEDAERDGLKWKIFELTNAWELHEEGEALHHCIGDYVEECQSGESAIFSLREFDTRADDWKRMCSVEIEMETKKVIEARAVNNEIPDKQMQDYLFQWFQVAKLVTPDYDALEEH